MVKYDNKIALCTTTISSPTDEMKLFLDSLEKFPTLYLIVAGDTNTPHQEYFNLFADYDRAIYLDPAVQEELNPKISDAIGWKCIQRRNMAFYYATKILNVDWILSMDDDNLPSFGKWISILSDMVGNEIGYIVEKYTSVSPISDPLQVTNVKNKVWHRGYPQEKLGYRNHEFLGYSPITVSAVDVVAMMWDGDLDVDAICRISAPESSFGVRLSTPNYWTYPNEKTIFNSQNTFVRAELIKHWPMLPFVGRMDDIWASYYLQIQNPDAKIMFTYPTVYQVRRDHTIAKDLRGELIGMENQTQLLDSLEDPDKFRAMLPELTQKFLQIWESEYEKN